jgi:hypothetical protein
MFLTEVLKELEVLSIFEKLYLLNSRIAIAKTLFDFAEKCDRINLKNTPDINY